MAGRKNLGRQKIKIEKIQNPNHLNVTFSKRRAGIFKKAHELSIMCGVEVGLICFSPGGKAFSYSNPNLAHVMNRFENGGGAAIPNDQLINDLNAQLAQIESQLEAGRKIGDEHDKRRESQLSLCWWHGGNRNQARPEADQQLAKAMENMKQCVVEEAAKLQGAESAPTSNADAKLSFDLNINYGKNGGAYPFAVGTSATASNSGN